VRPRHAILGLLTFTTVAAVSGCRSNTSGTGSSSCMDGVAVNQCMCGDTPVGPASQGACTVGQGCSLDGGPADGGPCQCVEMDILTPCP
jgi:hypothetical protein